MHFAAQKEHPERPALIRARELDLSRTIPWPVTAKETASRADHMWVSAHDVDIEIGTTISWRPRDHVIAIADLVVERVAGHLRVLDIIESPVYVDMLAKTLRRASRVTFSEMLPTPEQTWLPDGKKQTYTCELRVVAVDPTTWQPPLDR